MLMLYRLHSSLHQAESAEARRTETEAKESVSKQSGTK